MDFKSYILIGGKSSRMGKDKFSLVLNGKTFLEIAVETLQNFGKISLVGSGKTNLLESFPIVKDIYQNRGALSGIHSALTHSKSDFIIILACDYPFLTVELVGFLRNLAEFKSEFDAYAPIQSDGKTQPLCAIYKTEICRKILSEMLENEAENYSVRDFLNRIKTRYVEFSEIAHLPNSEHFFFNVNTPEDFILATKLHENCKKKMIADITKMTPNDAERILEIQLACGLEGWSAEDYRNETYRADSFNVTATINCETVGYLIGRLIPAERYGELYNIGVDPRFRRKKIANSLLAEFMDFCASENLEKIFLEVRESNQTAIKFYLKNNFAVIGKRKNFYSNPTEDAILMEKEISSTK